MHITTTYSNLKLELIRRLGEPSLSTSKQPQHLRNLLVAITHWCRELGIAEARAISAELDDHFDEFLAKFIELLQLRRNSAKLIRNKKYAIRKAHDIWLTIKATPHSNEAPELPFPPSISADEFNDFARALKNAMDAKRLGTFTLMKAARVSHTTIRMWLRSGMIPCKKAKRSVARVEKSLGLEEGSLANLVTWRSPWNEMKDKSKSRKLIGSFLQSKYVTTQVGRNSIATPGLRKASASR